MCYSYVYVIMYNTGYNTISKNKTEGTQEGTQFRLKHFSISQEKGKPQCFISMSL